MTAFGGFGRVASATDALGNRTPWGFDNDSNVADGDGVLETVTIPVYDSIGNAVAITDASGKAIERYEYTPYGTRTIRVDLTPPVVEQLREAGGKVLLEFSEEILLQRVRDAIASGQLTLRDTTDDAPIAITADQPVRDGKQKGRRLLLTPAADPPPGANHGMLLHIEPGAMVDLFENRPEMAYEKAFVWLGAEQSIDDTTPPRVDLVLTKAGELEVGFSEEIDPQIASAAILLDGAPRTWTAMPDGYTLKPASAISATTHSLQIGPALIDKAGLSLAEPFARSITTGGTDQIAYERPDPRVTPTSTLDNLASFQGHITDPATGLVYMRNRWMDPEMGRFMTADPMGYVDGPNAYSLVAGNPLGRTDPLGLYSTDFHYYVVYYIAWKILGDPDRAARIAFGSQAVDSYPDTEPVPVSPRVTRYDHQLKVLHALHFLDMEGGAVKRSFASPFGNANKLAEAIERNAIESGDDLQLGIFIHSLADTYAHEGFSAFWSPINAGGKAGTVAEIGHGEFGHSPDIPFSDTAKAASAAVEVARVIERYAERWSTPHSALSRETLRSELSIQFERFRYGDRSFSWYLHLRDIGVPVRPYDFEGRRSRLGSGIDEAFSLGIEKQRSWVGFFSPPSAHSAPTYWNRAGNAAAPTGFLQRF